jgi:hypothetical protein
VVLRSSRQLGASPRKVNVMSRDLFTVSEVGWGSRYVHFFGANRAEYIQKYEIYIQEGPLFLCPNIHWSPGSLDGVSLSAKKYV